MATQQLSKENSSTLIKDSLNKFVIKPLNAFGLGGFVFDIDGDETNKLQADITDHYVEDNSAIQDHIAKKPIEVTLTNYIGEIVKKDVNDFQKVSQKVAQRLTTIVEYAPALVSSANNIKNNAASNALTFDNVTTEGLDLWTLVKNLNPNATKQQKAYMFFKALFDENILVGLQTPWEFLKNMAIQTIVANQKEDSNGISNFTITLKQIRTTSTQTTPFDKAKYQERAKQQAQTVTDKGNATGSDKSLALKFVEGLF